MLKKFIKSPSLALSIVILFHLAGNIFWISLNNAPPAWDDAQNTRLAFQDLTLSFGDAYGPLVRFITGLWLLPFGPSVKLAQLPATIFFLLAIFSTYLLGKALFRNDWLGVLSAFIFSFYLAVYDNSRWLLLDIPLTFFVIFSIYLLVKSNFLENRRLALLTFLSFALVFFTKIQGIIYLIIPLSYTLILAVKERSFARLENFILGTLAFLAAIFPWVALNFKNISLYWSSASRAEVLTDPVSLLDPVTWFHYLKLFIDYEISFFPFLLFLFALAFYFRSRHWLKGFVLANIAFAYFLFTVFPNKDMRFLFPVLPFTALIFAGGLWEFSQSRIKLGRAVLIFLVIFSLSFYFNLSFGFPFKKGLGLSFNLPYIQDILYLNLTEYPVRRFDPSIWPHQQLISGLRKLEPPGRKKVILGFDNQRINNTNLDLFLKQNRVTDLEFYTPFEVTEFSGSELENYLAKFDYAVVSDQDISPFYLHHKRALDQVRNYFLTKGLAPVLTYQIPTGENLLVFPTPQ